MRILLEKYKNLSAPAKASLWFIICNIAQKGVALIVTPIFTRIMTTDQYGIYTIYQSWYQILTIFATLNLSAGVFNNGLTHFTEEKNIFVSAIQGLSTTITGILFVLYCINTSFWREVLELPNIFMLAMFAQFIFEPAYLFWAAEQRYNYAYRGLVLTTLLIAIGSPLLGILTVLTTQYKAEARVLSFVFIQVVIGIVFYCKNFRRGRCFYSRKYWKYALSFNVPLIPHYLSMTVLNQSDRIMIGKMIGTSEAGIYGIAYTLAMMMTIVTGAINNSFIPFTYQKIKVREFKRINKISNMLLLTVSAVTIFAMAFCPELIMIFASKKYHDAIWVMPPVATSVYFMFLYPLFANVEFYFEKTRFIMVASSAGAVLNIVLNYLFISKYGYYAAGYTTLVCYILFSFAHYYSYKMILKEKSEDILPVYDMRIVIGLSIVVLVSMFVMLAVYNYPIIRYVAIAVILVMMIVNREKLIAVVKEIRDKNDE